MIRRITVKNFMTHKSTVLDLAEGVTVITGPNNTGKSALVEAIRSIAHNPPTSRTGIRHGEKSAMVVVELDTGETVEWERTDKNSLYRIHGPDDKDGSTETYAKFGRTPPDDVRNLLRLDPVKTEGNEVDIHIGNQRQPIFLLDQTGSQAASFFAASTEAVHLLRMQQALKDRTSEAKSTRKKIEKKCADIENEIERLNPLESIGLLLDRTESLYQEIQEARHALPILGRFINELNSAVRLYGVADMECGALASLPSPPTLHDLNPLNSLIDHLESNDKSAHRLSEKQNRLSRLSSPPIPCEVQLLGQACSLMSETLEGCNKSSAILAVLDRTSTPPELDDVQDVAALMEKLESLMCGCELAQAQGKILDGASLPPALLKVAELYALKEELLTSSVALSDCERRLRSLSAISSPPIIQATAELATLIDSLHNAKENEAIASSTENVLQTILSPPEVHELKPLQTIAMDLEDCTRLMRRTELICEQCESIDVPPTLTEAASLEGLLFSLSRVDSEASCARKRLDVFDAVMPLPELHPAADFEVLLNGMAQLENDRACIDGALRNLEESLVQNREKIRKAIEEAGTCPLCGHILDMAHFLEQAHE